MQIEMELASESHVPRFRAGVGTWRSGYMIQIRLPWRHRARPSATLHEIQSAPKGKLVHVIVRHGPEFVNNIFWRSDPRASEEPKFQGKSPRDSTSGGTARVIEVRSYAG